MGRTNQFKIFRVSFYLKSEVRDGKAPIRFVQVTAGAAADATKWAPGAIYNSILKYDYVILKAYPWYGPKKPKKAQRVTYYKVSGPDSPATKEVLKDLSAMASNDAHERTMDTFKFPNRPVMPTKTAMFDGPLEATEVLRRFEKDPNSCPWHGGEYMVNGRCTRLDPEGPTRTSQLQNQMKPGAFIKLGEITGDVEITLKGGMGQAVSDLEKTLEVVAPPPNKFWGWVNRHLFACVIITLTAPVLLCALVQYIRHHH